MVNISGEIGSTDYGRTHKPGIRDMVGAVHMRIDIEKSRECLTLIAAEWIDRADSAAVDMHIDDRSLRICKT